MEKSQKLGARLSDFAFIKNVSQLKHEKELSLEEAEKTLEDFRKKYQELRQAKIVVNSILGKEQSL